MRQTRINRRAAFLVRSLRAPLAHEQVGSLTPPPPPPIHMHAQFTYNPTTGLIATQRTYSYPQQGGTWNICLDAQLGSDNPGGPGCYSTVHTWGCGQGPAYNQAWKIAASVPTVLSLGVFPIFQLRLANPPKNCACGRGPAQHCLVLALLVATCSTPVTCYALAFNVPLLALAGPVCLDDGGGTDGSVFRICGCDNNSNNQKFHVRCMLCVLAHTFLCD